MKNNLNNLDILDFAFDYTNFKLHIANAALLHQWQGICRYLLVVDKKIDSLQLKATCTVH